MTKQIGITIGVIIGLLLLVMSIAVAQTSQECLPTPPTCPSCSPVLNCPEIPACPACPSLTCADNVIQPQGLWEVTTNKKLCGEILLGASWVIIGGETLMLNKVKKMVAVEACQ